MIRGLGSGHDVVISPTRSALQAALAVCLVSVGAGTLTISHLSRILTTPDQTVRAQLGLPGSALQAKWNIDAAVQMGVRALAFTPEATSSGLSQSEAGQEPSNPIGATPSRRQITRAVHSPTLERARPLNPKAQSIAVPALHFEEAEPENLKSLARQVETRFEVYRATESVAALLSWSWTGPSGADSLPVMVAPGSIGDSVGHSAFATTSWFISNHQPAVAPKSRSLSSDTVRVAKAAPARTKVPVVHVSSADQLAIAASNPPVEYPTGGSPTAVAARQEAITPRLDSVNSQSGLSALDSSVVAGATTSVWSFEGWKQTSQEGWIVSSAQDQWPTLSYHAVRTEADLSVEPTFLSQREASILAATSGARLQADAGIVMGRIPAGFTVEISGRSEYPVYWRQGSGAVDSQDMAQERWFAFINVEPGMQVVSMVQAWTGERVPVAAAVVGGYSTFLGLQKVERVTIQGRVVDSGARREVGRPKLSIQRVGSVAETVVTDLAGRFVLPAQLVAGGMPIYLEMRSRDGGYPQRVRVSGLLEGASAKIEAGTIPYLTQAQVDGWIGQLEGGISPESGMIVTAWNRKGQRGIQEALLPVDHPMDQQPTLEPEIYFLDGEEQLNVEGSVRSGLTRAVTTQVVSGLHKLELSPGSDGGEAWSELAVASPGVISLQRTGF